MHFYYIYFVISIVRFCYCKKYMSINILCRKLFYSIRPFHMEINVENHSVKITFVQTTSFCTRVCACVYECMRACVRACFLFWSTSRRTKLAIRLELELRGSFLRSNSGFFCFAKHKSAGHGFLIPCIRIH